MTGRFLNSLPHVVIAVEVEYVRDKIESILIVLYFCVESSQVEAVSKIVLVNLAKILVSARRYKLRAHS